MTGDERRDFLEAQQVVNVATFGPRGWPHLMPLWFVVRDDELWAWTFRKSQKIRNLERDPRATLLVEAGDGDYFSLRGVQIEATVRLHADEQTVERTGRAVMARYAGGELSDESWEGMRSQVPKRIAMQFVAEHTVTWDHRKLGDTY